MYQIAEIKNALRLLKRSNNQRTKTARALGIKVRTLMSWRNKEKLNLPLLVQPCIHIRNCKFSRQEKKAAIMYYFNHGENVSLTCKILGYPKPSTLKNWLYHDNRYCKSKRNKKPKYKDLIKKLNLVKNV